jgi:hypothetical protein
MLAEDMEASTGEVRPGAVGVGWDLSFLGLGLHLATGAPSRPRTDPAWMASTRPRPSCAAAPRPGAKRHIASGEDRRRRGMAANTAVLHGRLMHAFDVLGDPVRRRLLELLADGERRRATWWPWSRPSSGSPSPPSRST